MLSINRWEPFILILCAHSLLEGISKPGSEMLPPSEEINWGIPCKETTLEGYNSANWAVVIDSLTGKRWATLVSLSMTMKIASFPFLDLGKPVTKSISMWLNFHSGIGRGWRSPAGWWCFVFTLRQTSHSLTNWAISRFIRVYQKVFLRSWYTLELPGWMERRKLCGSSIMTFLISPMGTTSRSSRNKVSLSSMWYHLYLGIEGNMT